MYTHPVRSIVYGFFGILIALGVVIAGGYGISTYHRHYVRSQALKDARNQVQLNDIKIAQTEQLVKVAAQQAAIRVADAHGIADSQGIIAGSLTPAYLQYLAIQAQIDMANGVNHTVVYIPTGPEGIPLTGTFDTANPDGNGG